MEHPELFMDYLVNRLKLTHGRAEKVIAARMMAVLTNPYDGMPFMYDTGFAAHLRVLAKRQQALKERKDAQRQV